MSSVVEKRRDTKPAVRSWQEKEAGMQAQGSGTHKDSLTFDD